MSPPPPQRGRLYASDTQSATNVSPHALQARSLNDAYTYPPIHGQSLNAPAESLTSPSHGQVGALSSYNPQESLLDAGYTYAGYTYAPLDGHSLGAPQQPSKSSLNPQAAIFSPSNPLPNPFNSGSTPVPLNDHSLYAPPGYPILPSNAQSVSYTIPTSLPTSTNNNFSQTPDGSWMSHVNAQPATFAPAVAQSNQFDISSTYDPLNSYSQYAQQGSTIPLVNDQAEINAPPLPQSRPFNIDYSAALQESWIPPVINQPDVFAPSLSQSQSQSQSSLSYSNYPDASQNPIFPPSSGPLPTSAYPMSQLGTFNGSSAYLPETASVPGVQAPMSGPIMSSGHNSGDPMGEASIHQQDPQSSIMAGTTSNANSSNATYTESLRDGKKIFSCSHCPYESFGLPELDEHFRVRHPRWFCGSEYRLECEYCSYKSLI